MSKPMIPSERAEFSAIVDRPPLKLPNNARLIFWTIVNYEVWDISRPMAPRLNGSFACSDLATTMLHSSSAETM